MTATARHPSHRTITTTTTAAAAAATSQLELWLMGAISSAQHPSRVQANAR